MTDHHHMRDHHHLRDHDAEQAMREWGVAGSFPGFPGERAPAARKPASDRPRQPCEAVGRRPAIAAPRMPRLDG